MSTNKIITGATGSGKTYKTIKEAASLGNFAYVAPCRQLAYEIFIDYSKDRDTLSTGEVKIDGDFNFYGVYESLQTDRLASFDSLIIDEAHFLTDEDRGGHLYCLISSARKFKLNIFLVTATRNFRKLRGFDIVELKSEVKPPKVCFVDYEEYEQRKEAGVPTIQFCKYSSEAMLSAKTLPSERLQLQLDFRAGRVNFISATNVLAQGINMPCENLYIEANHYDSDEVIAQKIGRLGRRGFTKANFVTVYISYKNNKIKKDKRVVTAPRDPEFYDWINALGVSGNFLPHEAQVIDNLVSYDEYCQEYILKELNKIIYGNFGSTRYDTCGIVNMFKYSRAVLEYIVKNTNNIEVKKQFDIVLSILENQAEKIKNIILNEKRGTPHSKSTQLGA